MAYTKVLCHERVPGTETERTVQLELREQERGREREREREIRGFRSKIVKC
jgi:hypothetical protein